MTQPRVLRRAAVAVAVLLACASVLPAAAAQPVTVPDVIARVKAEFAPDTRLAVFDVKAKAEGRAVELTGEVDRTAAKDALVKALHDAGYPDVADRITVLPSAEVAAQPAAIVSVSVAVMKTMPSHESELANELLMGAAVRVLKTADGWYYVQSQSDHYLGWMHRDHLAMMTQARADEYLQSPRVIATGLFSMVREQPSAGSQVVCDIVVGDILESTGRTGDWVGVQLPYGRTGYAEAAAVADYASWKASRHPAPETVEQTARQFVGVPYVWGGTSVKGFDCSGFTKTVYRLLGMELQRDADQQGDEGQPVAVNTGIANLRKGDLLFFGPRPGVTRITHVGIYLGEGRFIHCAGLVRINSFDASSPVYSETLLKRLVKARRMLPAAAGTGD